MSRVIYEQNLIGWRNFVRGRMSIDWGNMINKYLASKNKNKHLNAEKWGVDLLRIH
jgi:hypothetical protein